MKEVILHLQMEEAEVKYRFLVVPLKVEMNTMMVVMWIFRAVSQQQEMVVLSLLKPDMECLHRQVNLLFKHRTLEKMVSVVKFY